MDFTNKIISLQLLNLAISDLVEKDIVLCHGHFNVIHPGHLRFLQYARRQGKQLVVAVLGDKFLNSKLHYFNQEERAASVAALHDVDWVVVVDQITLKDIIQQLKPEVYVMGKEFEENSDDQIDEEIALVKKYGGQILFSSGEVNYVSSDLLHHEFKTIQREKMQSFQSVCERHLIRIQSLKEKINRFKNLKFLVFGDTIVDQYASCDPVGMSAEAPVLVLREMETKEFIGGAAIVACHIRALGAQCHFLSVTGDDKPAKFVKQTLIEQKITPHLLIDQDRPTTFKIRYMVGNQKILRVSRMQEHSLSFSLESKIIKNLESLIPEIDGLIISDYVYGVVTSRVLDAVINITKKHGVSLFGDLQCSSQIGNVSKFKQFDLICPTEREARIALSDQESGLEKLAMTLLRQTQCKNLLITLGAKGFIAYHTDNDNEVVQSQHFPALTTNPVDVTGAGDSLLSVMALSDCVGANLIESSVLGTCVSAITVNRIGNNPVTASNLNEFLDQLTLQLESTAIDKKTTSILDFN